MWDSRGKGCHTHWDYGMALLPEDMGCAGTDPVGDMAVQRISERREKEKGTGIPEAVPRDDTVSVGSTEHGLFGRKCIL